MLEFPHVVNLNINIALKDRLNGLSYVTLLNSWYMCTRCGWHTTVLDTYSTSWPICLYSRPKDTEFVYALHIERVYGLFLFFKLILQSFYSALALWVRNQFIPNLISTPNKQPGLDLLGVWKRKMSVNRETLNYLLDFVHWVSMEEV